jgi:RNA 2',3'-cyclic 3'-phosphodiesterase
MQEMFRLFIAIELSPEIHQNLAQVIKSLQINSGHGINWVKSENIHLTLKFLGDTPRKQIRSIIDILSLTVQKQSFFPIEVKGTGCFPTSLQPRVFWAGMDAPADLRQLQHSIDSALVKLNILPETRPFSPHLTLARVSDHCEPVVSQKLYQYILKYSTNSFGTMLVKKITLVQSTLTREGSIYSPQAYIPLHEII